MSPGSSTDSYPAFAHIGLRENSGKNLNQDGLQQVDVCLDHVGPTHWEKKQKTSKEKVVGRVPERDWSAVDENSEGQAGMEKTGRNYERYVNCL
ncbi:hypothetical protein ANN_24575 [Periplaneta americana]|uniref:Uncharacterized protein n=1 Tax=Periplaneta americana TaxID=6978 RepID=A0ABQ8S3E0_PERAM|nr:hypothetical protein ANN_24575 [Periplaneta americana]